MKAFRMIILITGLLIWVVTFALSTMFSAAAEPHEFDLARIFFFGFVSTILCLPFALLFWKTSHICLFKSAISLGLAVPIYFASGVAIHRLSLPVIKNIEVPNIFLFSMVIAIGSLYILVHMWWPSVKFNSIGKTKR